MPRRTKCTKHICIPILETAMPSKVVNKTNTVRCKCSHYKLMFISRQDLSIGLYTVPYIQGKDTIPSVKVDIYNRRALLNSALSC